MSETHDAILPSLTDILNNGPLGEVLILDHPPTRLFVQFQKNHRGSLILDLPFEILPADANKRLLELLSREPWNGLELFDSGGSWQCDVGQNADSIAELVRAIFREVHGIEDLSVVEAWPPLAAANG